MEITIGNRTYTASIPTLEDFKEFGRQAAIKCNDDYDNLSAEDNAKMREIGETAWGVRWMAHRLIGKNHPDATMQEIENLASDEDSIYRLSDEVGKLLEAGLSWPNPVNR